MPNHEHEYFVTTEGQRVIEKRFVFGDYELLVAPGCPQQTLDQIKTLVEIEGVGWFQKFPRNEFSTSRRKVFIPRISEDELVVVKQKAKVKNADGLKLAYFTQSIVHEFRTSNLMHELMQDIDLPTTISFRGIEYALTYEVQAPLAAMINLKSPQERFAIFKYIPGESVRDEVAYNGGWNYTDEDKRKLFGNFHQVLNIISRQLVKHGLEPWDLGVHQLIYTVDYDKRIIHIGLIDTEEYNFSQKYGDRWPDSFIAIGLPAVLPFL